jgi:hypothetical protein
MPTAVSNDLWNIYGKPFTCSNDRDAQIKDIFGRRAGFPHDFAILFYVDVGI